MLKPYYRKLKAVRITQKNYSALKKLDAGEGVLSTTNSNFEDIRGDWFVQTECGYELISGNIHLIPIKKR